MPLSEPRSICRSCPTSLDVFIETKVRENMFGECTETVSILYAVIFGADGACITLSTPSILTAFGAFMVLVVVLQFLARRLWKKLTQRPVSIEHDHIDPPRDTPYRDDPNYRHSAIRSGKS